MATHRRSGPTTVRLTVDKCTNMLKGQGKMIKEKLIQKRERQKLYYNRQTRPLCRLDIDQKVIFKKNTKWCYGKIVGQVNDNLFLVLDISTCQIIRRNCRYLAVTLNSKQEFLNDNGVKSSKALDDGTNVEECNDSFVTTCPFSESPAESTDYAEDYRNSFSIGEPAPSVELAAGDRAVGGQLRQSSRSSHPPNRYGDWEYYD